MCFKIKFKSRERIGCCLLVVIIIILLIGVLFGMGIFRHGYDKFKDLGRNHTCYDKFKDLGRNHTCYDCNRH